VATSPRPDEPFPSAHFLFEDDRLVCERAYFDQLTIMRQLGLAHDSRSLAGRLTMLVSHLLTSAVHSRAARCVLGRNTLAWAGCAAGHLGWAPGEEIIAPVRTRRRSGGRRWRRLRP
jgi:hypothetical protein